jgi:hypothetical protein
MPGCRRTPSATGRACACGGVGPVRPGSRPRRRCCPSPCGRCLHGRDGVRSGRRATRPAAAQALLQAAGAETLFRFVGFYVEPRRATPRRSPTASPPSSAGGRSPSTTQPTSSAPTPCQRPLSPPAVRVRTLNLGFQTARVNASGAQRSLFWPTRSVRGRTAFDPFPRLRCYFWYAYQRFLCYERRWCDIMVRHWCDSCATLPVRSGNRGA